MGNELVTASLADLLFNPGSTVFGSVPKGSRFTPARLSLLAI